MKNLQLPSCLLVFVVGCGQSMAGQSQLNAGDIVFLAANSDAPDTFAFSPLVNVEAGTVIHFTDNSRTSTGTGFADWRKNTNGSFSEAPTYTWVAPSAVTAGTKISIIDTVHGNMGLANGGDTLLAYQGDLYNPKFVSGIGWTSTDPFITTGTASANNSYVPSSLTLGTNAVEIAVNADNAGYNGITSGTTSALRSAVNTATNWTTSETIAQAGPASLTVTDAVDAVAASKELLGYNFGLTTASYNEGAISFAANTTLTSFGFAGTGTKDVDGSSVLTGQGFQVSGGWDTNSIDIASQYFGFTMTVASGFKFTLEDFGFAYQSSENITIGAFYSTDGFTTSFQLGGPIAVTDTNIGVSSQTNLGIPELTGPVEFRFYGSNAATGSGALELDEVWFQGSIAAVPEPATAFLGSIGLLGLLRRRRSN